MRRFGSLVLALLACMLTAGAGYGDDVTAPDRMVQAFRDYCINIHPTRIFAEVPKALGKWTLSSDSRWGDGTIQQELTLSWTERGDPHSRLALVIARTNAAPRACTIDAVWPEKSDIIRALTASVTLEAEPTVDTERDYEVIRWKTRAHGAPAVVELRVPVYAAKPGRSLTLVLGR